MKPSWQVGVYAAPYRVRASLGLCVVPKTHTRGHQQLGRHFQHHLSFVLITCIIYTPVHNQRKATDVFVMGLIRATSADELTLVLSSLVDK